MAMSIVQKAEEFVKIALAGVDGSHDWWHVHRVRCLALTLAKEEDERLRHTQGTHVCVDMEIVELAALLHDVADVKYSGSETLSAELLATFFREQAYDQVKSQRIIHIIDHMSFRKELQSESKATLDDIEFRIVQDADRLDAIGAVGIARCFAFGGMKRRPLYDPTQPLNVDISVEEYTKYNAASINHFYEKLLKLKDMMKTEAGRKIANQRHAFMQQFLDQFFAEWKGIR